MNLLTGICNRFFLVFEKEKTQRILIISILILIFVGLLLTNLLYPLINDDFIYSYIYNEEGRLRNINDIVISQYRHYFAWGGRVVVHFIAQFMLLIGTEWSAVLKALAGTSMIYLMYKIANVNKSGSNVYLLILVTFMTWFFQDDFGFTILWTTGAANYLFGTLIILAFMYPYILHFYKKGSSSDGIFKSCLFFILGLIAGWTNENTAVGLAFFLVGILFLHKINAIKISRWNIMGLFGAIIGTMALILAPGNFNRLRIEAEHHKEILHLYNSFAPRIEGMQHLYTHHLWTLLILFVGCLIFLLNLNYIKHIISSDKKNISKVRFFSTFILSNKYFQIALLCFLAANFAFFIMIGSPLFPARALFGIIIFFITAIGMLYTNIQFDKFPYKLVNFIFIFSLFIILCSQYISAHKKVKIYSTMWKKREQIVKEEKLKGNLDIVFEEEKPIRLRQKMELWDISTDSTHWQNIYYVRYYGLKSLTITPLEAIETENNK